MKNTHNIKVTITDLDTQITTQKSITEINKELEILTDNKTTKECKDYFIDFMCENSTNLFIFNIIILVISCVVLTTITILYNSKLDKYFWLNQGIKYVSISIIQYLMAMLVVYKNIKVNYTRKVIHVAYFIIPQLLDIVLIKYEKDKYTALWNVWIILFLLFILSEPVRKKLKLIETMFKAVDRPEDRPYTLIWFSSQIITTLIVIIPFSIYFSKIDKIGFVFIPILVNGLADGLAEPVGIKFGKHKYKTRACLSNRTYERSYEGSLCVFVVTLIIILSYYKYMFLNQYIFCVLTIPITTTFTEAYSPHTWDSPCLFFVVCSFLTVSNYLQK